MKNFITWVILAFPFLTSAQTTIEIDVDASNHTGAITPLWGDHYEMHLPYGTGGNPILSGPHEIFTDDPKFIPEMQSLQPRYIRVSNGRFENPPDTSYFSTNNSVLKNLWYEFYKGKNTMADANEPSNYDFSFVDSVTNMVRRMGAEPFFELGFMPFRLSSDTTATYNPLGHLYTWDNSIRNSPPLDLAVYSRVMYHQIKHLHEEKGVVYFELWNEPDQFPLNTFFWKGSATELFNMYAGIVGEIEADTALSNHIRFGGCSFAMNSFANLFPISFLNAVKSNNIRMDFLSFHPYAGNTALGGYSPSRVSTVTSWRNTYVPDAALINAEWAVLNASFGSAGWSGLDYGLERAKALIDMNDRDIVMAHEATLADYSATSATCCHGMYYTDPVFSPKASAYVYKNLVKLNATPIQLDVNLVNAQYALAGASSAGDTVVLVFPADKPPSGVNTVQTRIHNLPWASGIAYRYELTETSFRSETVFNLVDSVFIVSNGFRDTVLFSGDQNSGALYIWELIRKNNTDIEEPLASGIRIYPNPSNGCITLERKVNIGDKMEIDIFDFSGRKCFSREVDGNINAFQIELPEDKGIYLIRVGVGGKTFTRKIITW